MEKFTINKSIQMYELKEYNTLSIGESRLINSYISRIHPFDTETAFQEIPIKWIVDNFNLKTETRVLKAVETFTNEYTTADNNKIKLFDILKVDLNADGEKCIVMKCSTDAEQYFFNLSEYVKYDIANIKGLKQHKTITFYEIIKHKLIKKIFENEKKSISNEVIPITIKIFDVINILNFTANINSYSDFKNQFMIKAIQNINKYTDLSIDCKSIIKHRLEKKVTAITFSVKYANSEKVKKLTQDEIIERNKDILSKFVTWNDTDYNLKIKNKNDIDTIKHIMLKYYQGCNDEIYINDTGYIYCDEGIAVLSGFSDAPLIIVD